MPKSLNWERNWSVAAHLAAVLGILSVAPLWKQGLYLGIPLLNLLIPYLLWMKGRNFGFFIDHHACESLNFQLTITLFAALVIFLAWTASGWLDGVRSVALLTLVGLFLFNAAMAIWAAVRTYDRQTFTYPLSFQFVKTMH